LGYTTKDVRAAYNNIKKALISTNPELKKVVVIAHSQGGIILSMALDNLLSDLPRERSSFQYKANSRFQEIRDLHIWMCGQSLQ
jgi:esterase/lipase superfamily enzyme